MISLKKYKSNKFWKLDDVSLSYDKKDPKYLVFYTQRSFKYCFVVVRTVIVEFVVLDVSNLVAS